MMSNKEAQIRATFKDTKKSQKVFRETLDLLIATDKPVSEKDREDFFNLLADSTLGLGTKEMFFYLDNGKKLLVDNFEEFIRSLAYFDDSVVDGDFFFRTLGKYRDYTLNIGELWVHIRNRLGGIFAEALAMSIRISKEQTHLGASEPARV